MTAKHFVTSGRHSWNSGMFVWKVSRFLDELSRTMPEFYQQLPTIDAALGTSDYDRVLREVWQAVKTQTLDYGNITLTRQCVQAALETGKRP